MKKTVWKMLPVEPFDMRGLEEWLSDMAAKGLHLVKIGESFARFIPGQPQEGVRYALDVKDWSDIDPERNDMYQQAGWEYVTTLRGLYYVYRTRDPGAPALHTDPITQSFTFDRLLRRRLWALLPLIPFTLFLFRNELSAFFQNPWSPVYLFLMKTEGCCLYLLLVAFYFISLVPLFRQRRALKALQKQLAEGTPLGEIHFRPRRVPYAVLNGTPLVLMVCALVLFIWKYPHRAQQLPNPEDWDFPYVTLEQALEGADIVKLASEDPHDAMLHWPTRRSSFLVPERINWRQNGTTFFRDGTSQECFIDLDLYRLRFPDLAPLLLRCIQEETRTRWDWYREHSGGILMNPVLVEFQDFQTVGHPAFDELTVMTWRTEDQTEPRSRYIGRVGDLVFDLTCFAPADIDRVLELLSIGAKSWN